MLKDSAGFLWLATKDGLSRFDGYQFKNYKVTSSQFHCSVNSQFLQIEVDIDDNLWLRNSLGQVFCFDQLNKNYSLFPKPETNRGEDYFYAESMRMFENGDIWLCGGEYGAIRIRRKHGDFLLTRFFYG